MITPHATLLVCSSTAHASQKNHEASHGISRRVYGTMGYARRRARFREGLPGGDDIYPAWGQLQHTEYVSQKERMSTPSVSPCRSHQRHQQPVHPVCVIHGGVCRRWVDLDLVSAAARCTHDEISCIYTLDVLADGMSYLSVGDTLPGNYKWGELRSRLEERFVDSLCGPRIFAPVRERI